MTQNEILKNAKPILFNTEMVKAILDGLKTETRRVVKPQPDWGLTIGLGFAVDENGIACKPKYSKGDILYVRETWNYGYIEKFDEYLKNEAWFEELDPKKYDASSLIYAISGYCYKADMTEEDCKELYMKWRPSIHMPKEAARIFLKVTNVSVERLQDITADDVRNEGLTSAGVHCGDMEIASAEFAKLWDSTIKKSDLDKYGWEANPWVFVISFDVLRF